MPWERPNIANAVDIWRELRGIRPWIAMPWFSGHGYACAGALLADVWEVNALVLVGLVCGLKSVSATSDLLPRFVLPTFTDCGLAARSQASSEALPAKLSHELSQAVLLKHPAFTASGRKAETKYSGFAEAARDTSLVSHTTYCGGRLGSVAEGWATADLPSSVLNASDVAAPPRTPPLL